MTTGFIPNEREAALLREVTKRVLGNTYKSREPSQEDDPHFSPDVYVAKPQDVGGIPARVDDVPGTALCDIYRLSLNGTDEMELEQTGYAVPVYNLSTTAVSQEYIQVHRDKYGTWLAITAGGDGSAFFSVFLLEDLQANGGPADAVLYDEINNEPTSTPVDGGVYDGCLRSGFFGAGTIGLVQTCDDGRNRIRGSTCTVSMVTP